MESKKKEATPKNEEVQPLVVGGPCPFILGNGLQCKRIIVSGTMCPRHTILQPIFGTTIPALDYHEKVGPQG